MVSPLTRALETALRVFGARDVPLICHPGVAEVGGGIPENEARSLAELRAAMG